MSNNQNHQEGTVLGEEIDQVTGIDVANSSTTNGEDTIETSNGDVLKINESHRARAGLLFQWLRKKYPDSNKKLVISVGGPSGSGKSEIGALITSYFNNIGVDSILVPCDNYPIRAPKFNDLHRREIFDTQGKDALAAYLGSEDEILFSRLGQICNDFQSGSETIDLRRINMQTCEITESIPTKVGHASVLVFEGTWSCKIPGLNESVFLNTNYKKTAAHRKNRARIETQNDENRLFIENYVLPFEQVTLERICQNLATVWLTYEENGEVGLIENKK